MAVNFWRRSAEPTERIYAIGDVHGRLDLFKRLIQVIDDDQASRPPMPTRIILLGDIVDRGPDSASMVRGCMKLTAHSRRFMVLKGNHEEMMAEALRGDVSAYRAWLRFGGTETLLSWGVEPSVAEGPATIENLRAAAKVVGSDVIAWLQNLPLHHRHEDFLFVHAGIRPGIPIRKQQDIDLLWITDDFLGSEVDHDLTVVHGHSIVEDGAEIRSNRIGIDTGAYRTDRLTALGVENGATWLLDTKDEIASAVTEKPSDGSAVDQSISSSRSVV